MFTMAPYLRLAKTAGNENEFYDMFFKSWFKRWPETSIHSESIEKEIKKVCTLSILTVTTTILISCLINRWLKVITRIF